jgi:hypothetical protein
MNFVLKVRNLEQYTIYGVRKTMDGFVVRSKTIDGNGQVLVAIDIDTQPTLEDANEMARKVALMKSALKGRVVVDDPPDFVKKHFETCDREWVSNQQMVGLLTAAKRERYVVFRDILGLEGRFDIGVEYLAFETDDEEFLDVTDNFGETLLCMKSRFALVEMTEAGREVEAIELRGKRREAKETTKKLREQWVRK